MPNLTGRAIAHRHGLDAVTVRAVADRLDTSVAALRREIGDRDGLVVAMLDALAAEIDLPDPVADPRAELVALALAVHDVLRGDPWAVRALAVDGLAGPLILPVVDRVFASFRSAGVPDPELATVTRVLWDHVFGAALTTDDPDTFAARLVHSADPSATTEPAADHARIGVGALVDGLLSRYR